MEGIIAVATTAYVIVASCQLGAMNKALKVTKRAMALDQRPWVFVQDISVLSLEPNKENLIQLYFVNTGHSPAYIFEEDTNVWMSKEPLPEFPPYGSHPQNFILPPGPARQAVVSIPLTSPEIVAGIKDRIWSFYLFGYIKYRDVLAEHHRTGFLLRYNPNRSQFDFLPLPNYTYAD